MKDKMKNRGTKSETLRKELAHLAKLYKARKAALDKMSKLITENNTNKK